MTFMKGGQERALLYQYETNTWGPRGRRCNRDQPPLAGVCGHV
jgi:hypothetical protein